MSKKRNDYQEQRWRRLRQEVLAFDGRKCRRCGKVGSAEDPLHVNHIIPVNGHFDTRDYFNNLETLCSDCHSLTHIRQQAFLSRRLVSRLQLGWERWRRGLPYEIDEASIETGLQRLGKSSFRPGQRAVVMAALGGKSVLFVSPTGSGKSLAYQLPALLKPGMAVVMSPLNALMSDQVQQMLRQGIPTTYINSTLSREERVVRLQAVAARTPKLFYCTPERFVTKENLSLRMDLLTTLRPSYLIVDEAHVVPAWGGSFRPAYRRLREIREALGNPPVIALTATATLETQQRILGMLGIKEAEVVINYSQRRNISLIKKRLSSEQMEHIGLVMAAIEGNPAKTIVFVPTIKRATVLHRKILELRPDWIDRIAVYHSEKDSQDKEFIEARFSGRNKPDLRCIIATSAFGMGIDIPDIRLVVHYGCPASLDDYVQGIGRAGRDGQAAAAILLYTDDDLPKWVWMRQQSLKESGLSKMDMKRELTAIDRDAQVMRAYAHTTDKCLHEYIENHFSFSNGYWGQLKKLWRQVNTPLKAGQACCSNCRPEALAELNQMIMESKA